jgi:hypothetical protein
MAAFSSWLFLSWLIATPTSLSLDHSLFAIRCRYLSWLIATPTCLPFDHSPLAIRHSLSLSVVADSHSNMPAV